TAQLDEDGCPGVGGDVRGSCIEDLALAPCRVVLLESRDVVEELRAAVVVEPLRWQHLRRRRQPDAHVAAQRAGDIGRVEMDVDGDVVGHSAPIWIDPWTATTTLPSPTATHPSSSSNGSDATTASSVPSRVNSESPAAVATTVVPSLSTTFSRDPGASACTRPTTDRTASSSAAPRASSSSTRANSTSLSVEPCRSAVRSSLSSSRNRAATGPGKPATRPLCANSRWS